MSAPPRPPRRGAGLLAALAALTIFLGWLDPADRLDRAPPAAAADGEADQELLERWAELRVAEPTPVLEVRRWYSLSGVRKLCEQADGDQCARDCRRCILAPGKAYRLYTVMLREDD